MDDYNRKTDTYIVAYIDLLGVTNKINSEEQQFPMNKLYNLYTFSIDATKAIQIHEKSLSWASDKNSPIVLNTLQKYVKSDHAKILDIGCGEGRDCLFLLDLGYDIQALDISKEAIHYCKNKAGAKNENRFHILDVCSENFNGTFDFIYSVATLHMLVLQQDRNQDFSDCRFGCK